MFRTSLVAVSLLLSACSSTGDVPEGVPIRVTWTDSRTGQSLGLVNESHTAKAEQYSRVRPDASVKVISDEVMAALVEQLRALGLDEFGQSGRALGGYTHAIEVDVPGGRAYLRTGAGSSGEERGAMNDCRTTFLAVFNLTNAYQTVENQQGGLFFDDQQR